MTLDEIRSIVALEVVGCPNTVVDSAIIRSARDICRVGLWRHKEEITLVSGTAEYTLTIPTGGELFQIISVGMATDLNQPFARSLEPLDYEDVHHDYQHLLTNEGAPAGYMVDGTTLHVLPVPDDKADPFYMLQVISELSVSLGATELPDVLLPWQEGIAYGALMILQRQNKPWGSDSSAKMNEKSYRKQRTKAMSSVLSGWTDKPLMIKARGFV